MRHAVVTIREWQNNRWVNIDQVTAIFHQFVTESNEDGNLFTMAIVEYSDGTVDSVPLSQLKLGKPVYDLVAAELASTSCFSEGVEQHIKEIFNQGLYAFSQMCNNISSMRR